MATDKLINMDQGDDIIDALSDIATNINTITYGPQTSADKVVSMTGYQKSSATDPGAISQGDTLNEAVGKLEKRVDNTATAIADKIESYTDATTSGHVVTFNNSTGTQVTDSGVSIATSTTGVTDVDTTIPTSKSVVAYAATKDHTHNYAGSSSAGGAATSADKLNIGSSNIGSATQPVYFDKTTGKPVAITNTIQSNVPANAVFTDTTYTVAEGTANGKIKVTPSSGTAYEVPVHGLGNAAYKGVATSVSTSEDLVTSKAVNTKLASYVPNSDFVVAEDNILYGLRNGAKNLVNLFDTISSRSCTATELENGGMRLACTNAVRTQYFVNINLKPATQYVLYTNMANFSGTSIGAISIRVQYKDEHGNLVQYKPTQTGEHTSTFTTESTTDLKLSVLINDSDTARTQSIDIWVMICEKVIYDTDPSYVSVSLPNCDLTRLEAKDRTALAEEIDAGAKNKIDVDSVTLTGAGYIFNNYDPPSTLPAGTYVLSCMSSQSTAGNLQLQVYNTSLNLIADETISSKYGTNVIKFTITETAKRMHLYSNVAGTFWNLIVCTKAAFGVSSKFVPYRPNWDLVDSRIDVLEKKSYMSVSASSKYYLEIANVSTDTTSTDNRGAILVSIPYQTGTYIPSLYLVHVTNGVFRNPISLTPTENATVISTTISTGDDGRKIYFEVRGSSWCPPVIVPLFSNNNEVKLTMRYLDAIPT